MYPPFYTQWILLENQCVTISTSFYRFFKLIKANHDLLKIGLDPI
jgi:hypothetical protein